MFTGFFSSFCSTFKIAGIITCIKNTENVDTVLCGTFNKLVYNIICIVAVTKKVLTAQQHHNLCIWHSCMKLTQTFPWIFVQEADTAVISCSAPCFCCKISNFVNFRSDWKHVCCCHTCCMK